jgi:hypothetical protein
MIGVVEYWSDALTQYSNTPILPYSNNPFFLSTPEIFLSSLQIEFFQNLKIRGRRSLGQFKQNPSIASFQHGMLESRLTWMSPEASLRIVMPAIHAGMTICIFMFCGRA